MTFLLCDPGWYVHKPDVQNEINGIITHTNTTSTSYPHRLLSMSFSQHMDNMSMCLCVFLPFILDKVRWMYQPGSHRRKFTQDFASTFLLRCVP